MDFFDRRIARRLARELGLADHEVIDFDMGTSRPLVALPPPLTAAAAEQARIEVVLSADALRLRVVSRSARGEAATIPWSQVRTFGPVKAEGRWRRWSLRGELRDETPIVVSLGGRPRPSFVEALRRLGIEPA